MEWILLGGIVLFIFVVAILAKAIVIIKPYEEGIYIFMGTFKRVLKPGLSFVSPVFRQIIIVDERVQTLDVPRQEVITKDNSPTNVDAVIYIKVVDPKKAVFAVQNYKVATVLLAQTNLRSVIGDMELDEILSNRHVINTKLRDELDKATDPWGVKVESVEIKEVDPVGTVKKAMEEQTSAERERRAAILRADGKRRSAILEAEGEKRSAILKAEGFKQAKILEAEGEKTATILRSQGNAQKLRILSLGAAPLDHKALTVLSLDALKAMANGKSTKIIFPFEISRLVEGAAEYLGASTKIPDRPVNTMENLEKIVGKMDEVLGEIPNEKTIKEELKKLEEEERKVDEAERKELEEINKTTKSA